MRHPELCTDAATILVGIAELEGGDAADDLEPRELRERRDQVLRDPLREVLLLLITAQVHEWQDRDRVRRWREYDVTCFDWTACWRRMHCGGSSGPFACRVREKPPQAACHQQQRNQDQPIPQGDAVLGDCARVRCSG